MIKQYFFLLVSLVSVSSMHTKMPELTPENAQNLAQFFSLFPDPATTFPELSSLDNTVNLLFNKTLGISEANLSMIQRLYAYIKQEAVQDFIDKTASTTDPKKSLGQVFSEAQEQKEVALHHKDIEGLKTWTSTVKTLQATINQIMQKTLAPSLMQACKNTSSWQNHLKIFIANSFSYELELLSDINQDEVKMFTFLPQFETAYYSTQYTTLRNSANYVRMFLVLTDTLRSRALAQCNEWKDISDQAELYQKIETFKKDDFYVFCQAFDLLGSQKTLVPLQHHILLAPTATQKKYEISKGYRHYLAFTDTNPPQIVPERGMEALFSITNNNVSLTPLGAFLLEEKNITPVKGDPYPGLVARPDFFKLFKENQDGNGHVPTKLFLELASFNAIRILGSLTNYLFNLENLPDTMKALDTLQKNKTFNAADFPNIILYEPEDQLLLEELNTLTALVAANPIKGATPAGFWDDVWDDIKDTFETMSHLLKKDFEKIGDDLWHTIKDTGDFFVHLSYSVEDLGIGLYYQTGIACLATGITYSQASSDAGSYFNGAAAQLESAGTDCMGIVGSLTDVAQQVTNIASTIVAQTLGALVADPRLGTDLANCFDEVAAISLDAFKDAADFLIKVGVSLVRLTFEAIMILEESAMGVIMAGLSGGSAGAFNDLESTSQYFAKDLILSILKSATIFLDMFTDALKNLMMAIGYLTSAITDLIVDVAGEIAGLAALVTGGNFFAADESMQTELNAHRRLISSVVTLVLMTAITIATLGTGSALDIGIGVAMLVLGTGMMALSIVGANQKDMQAIYEKKSQEEFLATFKAYVNAIPETQNVLQAQTLNETSQRLNEQAANADRALTYYHNYMNSAINALRSGQAYQLSAFYNELLTPDTQNYPTAHILPADTGYVYGIQTNRFDLNPSKGFRVYNSARGTFAQEIATNPAPLSDTNTQSVFGVSADQIPSVSPSQHFIKQKDLANFVTNNLFVSVRFRVIYEAGGDFYIGIYLNKNYLDPAFLNALNANFQAALKQTSSYGRQAFENAWQPLNTFNRYLYNYDHLAKACVCYQNNQTHNQPALGIYEHSEKGFIVANQMPTMAQQPTQGAWFKRGTWYRMDATLFDDQVSVTFTEEDSPTTTWSQTAKISPLLPENVIPYAELMTAAGFHPQQLYTGSYGIITSGAAVEYEILKPSETITVSPVRASFNTQTQTYLQNSGSPAFELQREQAWVKQFATYCNPSFANWALTPFSNLTVAQGVYVYSTPSTQLPLSKNLSDYVISLANPPATNAAGTGQSLLNSGAILGQPITNTTPLLLSLVTGNAYNNQGQLQMTYPDALVAFQKTAQLPQPLVENIQIAQQAFFKKEEGAISFANVTVKGVDSALKSGIPVYSCPSFTQYLSGLDYLIFVNIPPNGNPGPAQFLEPLSSSNSINCSLSLVTGTVFNLVTGTTQNQINQLTPGTFSSISLINSQGAQYSSLFSSSYQPSLSPELVATIQKQINAYTSASTAIIPAPAPAPAPPQQNPLSGATTPGNSSCTSIQCIMNSSMPNNSGPVTTNDFNFN